MTRATRPEDRRIVVSRMKETLVQARVGLDDLRAGLEKTRRRLAEEEAELETVRRRKRLAEQISDRETVDIAAKYEQVHAERQDVLQRRVAAQEAELVLAEREVDAMSAELKGVLAGTDPRGAPGSIRSPMEEPDADSGLGDELDSLDRARAHADREADAARRLDELKRRMGK